MSHQDQSQSATNTSNGEVFTEDELRSFADELFDLDALVHQIEGTEPGEQLELDVKPGVARDDSAHDAMMRALRVANQVRGKRRRGERGGTSLHNQLREDLHKAWVVLGGWKFVVACVASKDQVLMKWALDLFSKVGANAGTLQVPLSIDQDADPAYKSFVMALQQLPEEAQQFTQELAQGVSDE